MQGSLPFAAESPGLKKRYPHLTRQKTGASGAGQRWSLEALVDGMRYFIDLYRHFPSLHEADTFEYLPSERTIRRSFGTMNLLKSLCEAFEATDAQREETYDILIKAASPMRVHERCVLRPQRVACDFLIYEEDGTPAVIADVLHVEDADELRKAIAVKRRLYRGIELPVLLIVASKRIDPQALDAFAGSERRKSRFRLVHALRFKMNAPEILSSFS